MRTTARAGAEHRMAFGSPMRVNSGIGGRSSARIGLAARIGAVRARFRRGGFAHNLWVMLAGTVLGQGTSVVLAPVLTRLYTPEQFGYLSAYTAALYILCVIASLGLEVAIPIAETASETANLFLLCVLSLAGTTALVAGLTWVIPYHTLQLLWLGPIASYRWLIPVGFACFGAYFVMVATATRQGAFGDIARTRIAQGLVGPGSQIGFGLLGLGAPGLVIGLVWGSSAGVLLLLRRTILASEELMGAMSWAGMRQAWRRYIAFPVWVSWARLVDTAGYMAIYLMTAAFYSPAVAGFLFLSDRVIARPLLIVSSSFLQVFTGEAGRVMRADPAALRRRFRQVVPLQFLLALGWVAVANVAASWFFPVVFGSQWDAAVPYLQAMSLAYLALTAVHPVSTMLQMLERQVMNAAWEVLRLVAVVLTVVVAWQAGFSAVQAIWLYSAVQAVCCLVLLGLIAASIERLQPVAEE
jgi:O-antigen/teichoic acid export membrane protein